MIEKHFTYKALFFVVCAKSFSSLILLVDIDDLVYGDVEHDQEGFCGIPRWSHALLVVGHEVFHETVFVLAARRHSGRRHEEQQGD